MSSRTARAFIFATLVGAVQFACADPFKPSLEDQVKLGQQAAKELRVKKDVRVLPSSDRRVVAFRRVAERLVAQIPAAERKAKPFQYTFDLIDKNEVNAFALPGGPVFFNTGLMEKLRTEDEVAGIIGHELTHIRNEHWARQYADEQKRALGWLVLLSAIKANKTIGQIANLTDTLAFGLKYSRNHESESDRVGYDLMVQCGYNPQGMVDVFRMFAKQGGRTPEFLNSHPDPGKRADAIAERIKGTPNARFPALRPYALAAYRPVSDVEWGADGWATVVR